MHNEMAFKPEIVSAHVVEELPTNASVQLKDSDPENYDTDCEVAELKDMEDLEIQLEHTAAALFLINFINW